MRFDGAEICGAALWAHERYVHICAFAKIGKNSTASTFLDAHNSSEPPPGVLSDAAVDESYLNEAKTPEANGQKISMLS